MKQLTTLFLSLLLAANILSAQTEIKGTVLETKGEPLVGVNISFYQLPDTTFIDGTISNIDGFFSLDLSATDSVQMLLTYVGYDFKIQKLDLNKKQSLDLGQIKMTENSEQLDEVEVTDRITRVEMNGDTVEFNAAAYKLNKSDLLEDLVKQLPGVTYQNGELKANGKVVKRIIIDGQDFFGDDIIIALKNLPAEMIAKVQLFSSEEEDVSSGSSQEQQINLVTKEGMNKGFFGRIEGGVGTNDRYQLDGMLNFFKPSTRLSLFFISNNINQQNFNYSEVTSTTEQGYKSFYELYSGDDNGLATTSAIGLNFNQKLKGKTQLGFSYLLNKKAIINEKNSFQQYFINDTTIQTYDESSNFNKTNFQQIFTVNFEWKKDSTQEIRFRPQFTLQNQDQSNTIDAVNTINENNLINQLVSSLGTQNQNYQTKGQFRYKWRSREKKKRRLRARLNYEYQQNVTEYELNAENYFNATDTTENIDQLSLAQSSGLNLNSRLNYTEPIADWLSMTVGLKTSYRDDVSDWDTDRLNPSTNLYEIPDPTLTNNFTRNEARITPRVSFSYGNDSVGGWVGFQPEWAQLFLDQSNASNASIQKTFLNPLPFAGFRISKGRKFSWNTWYWTYTQLPATNQLQPIVNNVNPLFLTVGNPNLDRSYSHSVGTNVRFYSEKTSQSVSLYVNFRKTLNYIGQEKFWAAEDININGVSVNRGAQYTEYRNLEPSSSLRYFFNYNIPIMAIGSQISLRSDGNYNSYPGLLNGVLNTTETFTPNIWLSFASNFSKDFKLSLYVGNRWNYSSNTIQNEEGLLTQNRFAGLDIEWLAQFGLISEVNINYTSFTGMSENFNRQSWLISGEIGYQFFENQPLGITVGVYDLLYQNIGISRNVTEMQINDVSNTVLTQFYYLKLSWQLRFFKNKKKIKTVAPENN